MYYSPSALETAWTTVDRVGQICSTAAQDAQIIGWKRVLQNATDAQYSRMTDGTIIEPLTGIARHPFAKVGCSLPTKLVSLFDTSYIRIPFMCHVDPCVPM